MKTLLQLSILIILVSCGNQDNQVTSFINIKTGEIVYVELTFDNEGEFQSLKTPSTNPVDNYETVIYQMSKIDSVTIEEKLTDQLTGELIHSRQIEGVITQHKPNILDAWLTNEDEDIEIWHNLKRRRISLGKDFLQFK